MPTFAIGCVPRAEWAHPLVLSGAWQRAQFTGGPPAAAPVAAALRLGDTVATAGSHLAQSLEDLREAEALPVVCKQGRATIQWGGFVSTEWIIFKRKVRYYYLLKY